MMSSVRTFDRTLDRADRVFGMVSRGCSYVAGVLLAVIMLVVVADVVGRGVFSKPLVGTVEIASNGVVATVVLVLPFVMHQGRHIRSTVLMDRTGPKLRRALLVFGDLVGAAAFTLIVWGAWTPAFRALRRGDFEGEGALRIPTAPIRFIILFAAIIALVECVNAVVRHATGRESATPAMEA